MKKILLLAFMAFPFLVSCSSDEDPEPDHMKIVGSWYETAFLTEDGNFADVQDGRSYIFNQDMTFVYDDGYLKEKGSFGTEAGAKVIHLTTDDGKKRTIAVTYSDTDHAVFKTNGTTGKYERR